MTADRETDIHDVKLPPASSGVARDLAGMAGLPLRISPVGKIEFLGGLPPVLPQARTLDDMRAVLYNQTATEPDELYLMYRGLGWPEDTGRLASYSLRFDLTVLASGLAGGEYIKTAGHYHPLLPGQQAEGQADVSFDGNDAARPLGGQTYPELYQVISGRAHYLLQRPAARGPAGSLADVVIVDCGPGQSLYVPPGYGHVTTNPGPEPLVMVNVVDASFGSVYGPYRERHGAAYYEIENDGHGYLVANEHYPDPPEPRMGRPTKLTDLGLSTDQPLYVQLAENPRIFGALSRPPQEGPLP